MDQVKILSHKSKVPLAEIGGLKIFCYGILLFLIIASLLCFMTKCSGIKETYEFEEQWSFWSIV